MLNRGLAYVRSSSTWPINLCAAEKMKRHETVCLTENMTYSIHTCGALHMKASQFKVNLFGNPIATDCLQQTEHAGVRSCQAV